MQSFQNIFMAMLSGFCAVCLLHQSVLAKSIQVAENSPLKSLMEMYLPDIPDSEDVLKKPSLRKESDPAIELGWKYFQRGDYETALKRFMIAIRLDPSNAKGYFGVAYVCSIQHDIPDAIIFYREALKYEKNYSPIYANLALALFLQNDKSTEVPSLLEQAIKIDPKNGGAYSTYALYFASKKNWAKAGEMAEKSIKLGANMSPEFLKELSKHGVKVSNF